MQAGSGGSGDHSAGRPQRRCSAGTGSMASSPGSASAASSPGPTSSLSLLASVAFSGVDPARSGPLEMPAFLMPTVGITSEQTCGACLLKNTQIKWKYNNGRGCQCWACGNVQSQVMDRHLGKSWSETTKELRTSRGVAFATFYIQLDQALTSYSRRRERHTFNPEIIELPEIPDVEVLRPWAHIKDSRDELVLLPIKQYVQTFCSGLAEHLPRDGHRIHSSSILSKFRILVEIPRSDLEYLIDEMENQFGELKDLAGRRNDVEVKDDDEEEDAEGQPKKKQRKGNASAVGAMKHTLARLGKVTRGYKTLSAPAAFRGFLRATQSLAAALKDKRDMLEKLPGKSAEVMDMIHAAKRGNAIVSLMNDSIIALSGFTNDPENGRNDFFEIVMRMKETMAHPEKSFLQGIQQPGIFARESIYVEAEVAFEKGKYQVSLELLSKRNLTHHLSHIEHFILHDE